jgi:hypothetical protein
MPRRGGLASLNPSATFIGLRRPRLVVCATGHFLGDMPGRMPLDLDSTPRRAYHASTPFIRRSQSRLTVQFAGVRAAPFARTLVAAPGIPSPGKSRPPSSGKPGDSILLRVLQGAAPRQAEARPSWRRARRRSRPSPRRGTFGSDGPRPRRRRASRCSSTRTKVGTADQGRHPPSGQSPCRRQALALDPRRRTERDTCPENCTGARCPRSSSFMSGLLEVVGWPDPAPGHAPDQRRHASQDVTATDAVPHTGVSSRR